MVVNMLWLQTNFQTYIRSCGHAIVMRAPSWAVTLQVAKLKVDDINKKAGKKLETLKGRSRC
jgi:hypothetical protein